MSIRSALFIGYDDNEDDDDEYGDDTCLFHEAKLRK